MSFSLCVQSCAMPASSYTATGRALFNFRSPHPLNGLNEVAADIQVADGFDLLVGSDTTIVPQPVRS